MALRHAGRWWTVTTLPRRWEKSGRAHAIPVRWRAGVMLAVTALAGLLAFCWPLLIDPSSPLIGTSQTPFLFAAILPLLLAVVLVLLSRMMRKAELPSETLSS